MSLLTTSYLPELLLRNTLHEPLQSGKYLVHILRVRNIHLGPSNQLLDSRQTLTNEVLSQPLIHLLQDQLSELGVLALSDLEDAVQVPAPLELLRREPLAHDQRLVGLCEPQARDQRPRRTALGDEAQRGKGREEEGVRRRVDEVGKGDDGGGQADDGPVEADDEDLGVCGEGVRDVEVEGDEGLEPVLVKLRAGLGSVLGD
jgi:hypothetical protein